MAAGDVNTNSGSKIYAGSLTSVAPNPLVDSYTEVAEVTNMGEFGVEAEQIEYSNLSNRNVKKFKGQLDDGSMDLELGHAGATADAGQAILRTAARSEDNPRNFKVTLNDDSDVSGATPTTFYFSARVMSYRVVVGGINSVVAARSQLGIVTGTITKIEPS